jgi:hypothetical protein
MCENWHKLCESDTIPHKEIPNNRTTTTHSHHAHHHTNQQSTATHAPVTPPLLFALLLLPLLQLLPPPLPTAMAQRLQQDLSKQWRGRGGWPDDQPWYLLSLCALPPPPSLSNAVCLQCHMAVGLGGGSRSGGGLPLKDIALLSMVVDKIGGDTVLGGWTIPHLLSLGVIDNADANAHQIVKTQHSQV